MRGRGLALLAFTGGCNAIFGLNGNLQERDASPFESGIDSAYWPMRLTWQVLESPTGPIDYPPIAGATVQIGPVDAPEQLHMLTLNPDGTFLVPNSTPKPYRLVYTAGSLPTEIQSSLESGHFVVPMVGRVDRAGTPSHALIHFAPGGAPPAGTIQGRVITIGLWTVSAFTAGNDQFSLPFDYDYQVAAASMSGPQGSLDLAHGDLEVVTQISNGDVIGYAVASIDHLNPNPPGPSAPAAGTWSTAHPESLKWKVPNSGGPLDPNQRMMSVLVPYSTGNNVATSWGGVIPSDTMPNFIEPVPGGLDGVQLAPLSTTYELPHQFANPFADAMTVVLPTAIYTQDTNFRMVGNVKLTSGFQGIALQTTAGATVDMSYTVGFAHVVGQEITLTPAGGAPVMLVGSEGQTVTLGGAKLVDLTFATDRAVDDCVVTIYQLDTSSVIPVRRLLLQQPPASTPFRIDASVFAPGKTYVLGVVCRKGQPGVPMGDYTQISYPYQTSTLYSRTFTVVP